MVLVIIFQKGLLWLSTFWSLSRPFMKSLVTKDSAVIVLLKEECKTIKNPPKGGLLILSLMLNVFLLLGYDTVRYQYFFKFFLFNSFNFY